MIAVLLVWAVWLLSWVLARGWSKPTVGRPAARAEILYTIVVDAGFVLMIAPVLRALGPRLWVWPPAVQWTLVAATGFGLGLCWWARISLGRNWSWTVTLKEAHEVVESGPYRLVRHPIYTGLVLAGAATTLLEAKPLSAAGYVAMVTGLWIKARLEERFLRSTLGEAAYDPYAARTGMLFPRLSAPRPGPHERA